MMHAMRAMLLLLLAGACGCQLLGIVAAKAPPRTVPAAYQDLAGRRTAVWVWVDRAVDLDYPRLSLDVATRVQTNLASVRDGGNNRQKRELAGISFPVEPASIVRYQKRDPTLNMAPITQIAPRLDVERLIYIEIANFTTQGGAAAGLMRGVANIDISVIEVDATGEAREGFREQGVQVVFPRGGPAEGSSTTSGSAVYQGLAATIADEVTLRLVSHPEQEQR